MLKLSRKGEDTILIGNHIKIAVEQIKSESVIIRIETPGDDGVFREEIYQQTNDTEAPRKNVNAKWQEHYAAHFLKQQHS